MLRLNLVIHIGAPDPTWDSPVVIVDVKVKGHKKGRPSPNAKGGCREVRSGDGTTKTETYPSLDAHALREARGGKCHNCEISEAKHKGKSTHDASNTMAEEVSYPPENALSTCRKTEISHDAGSLHTCSG